MASAYLSRLSTFYMKHYGHVSGSRKQPAALAEIAASSGQQDEQRNQQQKQEETLHPTSTAAAGSEHSATNGITDSDSAPKANGAEAAVGPEAAGSSSATSSLPSADDAEQERHEGLEPLSGSEAGQTTASAIKAEGEAAAVSTSALPTGPLSDGGAADGCSSAPPPSIAPRPRQHQTLLQLTKLPVVCRVGHSRKLMLEAKVDISAGAMTTILLGERTLMCPPTQALMCASNLQLCWTDDFC